MLSGLAQNLGLAGRNFQFRTEIHSSDRRLHAQYHQPTTNTNNSLTSVKMGRVRTKTVKKSAKVVIERYYPRLTLDFETNKRICDEIAVISSKRLRNKVCIRA